MITREELNDLSIDDYFALSSTALIYGSDVSDFEEGEIRCLSPKNPVTLLDIEKWDGILNKKEPVIGDWGIDKNRKVFVYLAKGVWKPLK